MPITASTVRWRLYAPKAEQIKELQEGMAQSWHLEKNKPFQSFELSNNNAEIRRIRGRIEQLKQHEENPCGLGV